jgi:hypothetical protein
MEAGAEEDALRWTPLTTLFDAYKQQVGCENTHHWFYLIHVLPGTLKGFFAVGRVSTYGGQRGQRMML